MAFKDNLKEARIKKGLKQEELAKLLGVSKGAIGNYEAGISFAKADILYKLFDILEVTPNYLFQDDFYTPVAKHSSVVDLSENKEETILDKYNMLDDIDKVKIEERIDTFLEDDKYKKELKQA